MNMCSVLSAQKPEARSQKPEARSQREGLIAPVKQKNSGFTLVELSIVLVIIGLLVGGILAGADLIRAAKVGKIISEREQIMTAMNTFYLKYNCIPGDCYNISTYLSGETNGDGDEVMENTTVASNPAEIYAAWKQMAAATLYPGNFNGLNGSGGANNHSVIGTNIPGSKAISKAGYSFYANSTMSGDPYPGYWWNGTYGNIVWFGKENSNTVTLDPALKPVDAHNIDKKLDDGIPGTGKVRALYANISSCTTSGSSTASPSSSAYYITNDSIACALGFILD